MRTIFFALILCNFQFSFGQNVFSEYKIENKKPFAPYETPAVVALKTKEFVVLLEQSKGDFKLIRYDQYFLDRWTKIIDYNREGSYPKLLKLGDNLAVFRFWTLNNSAYAEVRIYDINSGELLSGKKEVLSEKIGNEKNLKIKFSPDFQNFLLYQNDQGNNGEDVIKIYRTSDLTSVIDYSLNGNLGLGKTKSFYLNENGNLFLVFGDPVTFQLDAYYFSVNLPAQPIRLSSSFTFDRPADLIPVIFIIKQSESAYLVATAANIGDELIGVNMSSFNVVLKSLLFSNSFNFDEDFINDSYDNSSITSIGQRKKFLADPEKLEDFSLQELIMDEYGSVTLLFEKQDILSTFHNPSGALNMSLKWEDPGDRYYYSEDILMVNFSSQGEMNWKKVIQKSQSEKGHGLGLSYISERRGDELIFIVQEEANGDSFYCFKIDLATGDTIYKRSFFDKKTTYNKNYSGWIDEKTLLICGYSPNSNNRTFYLLEF